MLSLVRSFAEAFNVCPCAVDDETHFPWHPVILEAHSKAYTLIGVANHGLIHILKLGMRELPILLSLA